MTDMSWVLAMLVLVAYGWLGWITKVLMDIERELGALER